MSLFFLSSFKTLVFFVDPGGYHQAFSCGKLLEDIKDIQFRRYCLGDYFLSLSLFFPNMFRFVLGMDQKKKKRFVLGTP